MADPVQVRIDMRDVNRALRGIKSGTPIAISRAMNRTIGSVQTAAVREVARDTGLRSRDVRKAMALERATVQALVAVLRITGRRIPLLAFAARQVRLGVTYRGRLGRGLVRSAFVATMRSSHRGVFKRWTPRRLPIVELFGPSLPHVFLKAAIIDTLKALAGPLLEKNLKHEVDFLLRRGA